MTDKRQKLNGGYQPTKRVNQGNIDTTTLPTDGTGVFRRNLTPNTTQTNNGQN